MSTLTRKPRRSSPSSDNALLRNAIDAIQQIDAEAKQKKMAQLESLRPARAAIEKRLQELNHQVAQIDAAVAAINGTAEPKKKRSRQNWGEARERIEQLLSSRKGQKFAAGDIVREFPELEGTVMSVLLKPLIQDGTIQVDVSEGIRRSKYFVA